MPYKTGFHTGALPFSKPRARARKPEYAELYQQLDALQVGGEWLHIDQLTEAELHNIRQAILSYAARYGDGWKFVTCRQRADDGTLTLWAQKISK